MNLHLVQRLSCRQLSSDGASILAESPSGAQLFSALFGIESMGSSEYDASAIRVAYEVMSNLPLEIFAKKITRSGKKRMVYFIAATTETGYDNWFDHNGRAFVSFDQALEEFKIWFSNEPLPTKGASYFDTAWLDDPVSGHPTQSTIAWWAIRDNIAWTMDESIALELLAALSPSRVYS